MTLRLPIILCLIFITSGLTGCAPRYRSPYWGSQTRQYDRTHERDRDHDGDRDRDRNRDWDRDRDRDRD